MLSRFLACSLPERLPPGRAIIKALPPTAVYLAVAALLLIALPDRAWYIKRQALIAISLFGLWRYAWQVVHAVRHWYYRKHAFPRLRVAADGLEDPFPKRLFVMVPSFQEDFNVTEMVFEALVREARSIPSDVIMVASVGSEPEAEFIAKTVAGVRGGEDVNLVFMQQREGKRVAMGHALRCIAREFNDPLQWHPDARNDVVIFMDGDTLVQPGTFAKCLPFFRLQPHLGALTTDNIGMQQNCSTIFHDWYSLKFAQRNHQFHSHSLSRRVLTVTGRFSLYRASVVVREEFIRFVEADYLESWMFGRFRFLMGDDKSTWFYLLKKGYEMLYVPDAPVVAVESRQQDFMRSSISLMKRWYGNMLRNNMRAIRLGPKPMGGFIWWCIVDQRFTTWTPLVGLVSVLMLSLFVSPFYLVFFASWVIVTRLAMLWMYVLEGFELRVTHIPLMLFNQWVGAAVKIVTMFNLDKQTWQKKKTDSQKIESSGVGLDGLRNSVRVILVTLNFVLLFALCGLGTGAISVPSLADILSATSHRQMIMPGQASAGFRVNVNLAGDADAGAAIMEQVRIAPDSPLILILPEGRFSVRTPVVIDRSDVVICGQGPGKTVLVSELTAQQGEAVILVRGKRGGQVGTLEQAYDPNSRLVAMSGWKKSDKAIWLAVDNDEAFLDSIDARHWRKKHPPLRQYIGWVEASGPGYVLLRRSPEIPFPAGTKVRAARLVTDVRLSGFTLEQQVPGLERAVADGVYENLAPHYAVDGVRFEWAGDCEVHDVDIRMAGRHPLVFESSKDVVARNVRIDGAWNKGKEGNGYIRFARSHGCRFVNGSARNIRHLTFQWGSSNNMVSDSRLETDVNFHGGFSHHNMVRRTAIEPPDTHHWDAVTRMPEGGAEFAPPDGPANTVKSSVR